MEKTISQISQNLKDGKISSVELTKECLEHIKQSDLNAFITVDKVGAMRDAAMADEMIKAGKAQSLTGIPFGIKDAILTKGVRTTAGSKMLDDYIAPYDATVVRRLRHQGAVILGKNNMDEFAMGSSTENSAYGPTLNPLDKGRVSGGSSGGSAAAVAAGLCMASLGSDTGGSIRQPAAFCGVVGFKPTYGRVSRYGLIAMSSSLDQIGPITKTAKDAKVVFEAISGSDKRDATSISAALPQSLPVKNLRVGIIKEHVKSDNLSSEVRQNTQNAIAKIEKMGCEIVDISLPILDYALAIYYLIMPVEVASNLARFDGIKYGSSLIKDKLAGKLDDVYFGTRSRYFGGEAQRRIILGAYASSSGYSDKYYHKAIAAKERMKEDFKKTFERVDVIVGPTTPSSAFKFGEKLADPMLMYLSDVYTVPANLAGLPSISIPLQLGGTMPTGLQITGNANGDMTVLELAKAIEEAV